MSVISSLKQQTTNLTRKALKLGTDFVHPGSGSSGDQPDYAGSIGIKDESGITLPHTDEWGHDRPTITDIDPETGLLTSTTKGNPPLDEGTSIYDLYADRAARRGDDILYTYKDGNEWIDRTANEFLAETRAIAKGLMKYGLKKGDGVAFMCRTCYEWNLTDAAIMAVGGVLATIYDTDSAEQIRNIVNNSDARLLIVQDTDMREKADGAIEECPSLEHIITINTGGLDELKAYGAGVTDENSTNASNRSRRPTCAPSYTLPVPPLRQRAWR